MFFKRANSIVFNTASLVLCNKHRLYDKSTNPAKGYEEWYKGRSAFKSKTQTSWFKQMWKSQTEKIRVEIKYVRLNIRWVILIAMVMAIAMVVLMAMLISKTRLTNKSKSQLKVSTIRKQYNNNLKRTWMIYTRILKTVIQSALKY